MDAFRSAGPLRRAALIPKPTTKWALNPSPQVSAVTTCTKYLTTGYENEFDHQWHLGLDGQTAVVYRVAKPCPER